MNPIHIDQHFSQLPEGVDRGQLRQRAACMIALAVGAMVPLPSAEVQANDLRAYFYDNVGPIKNVLFEINETTPFDVDRAVENAFRIWERRYSLAFKPCPHELFAPNLFKGVLEQHIPEFDDLKIGSTPVAGTILLIRDGLGNPEAAE